MRSVNEIIKDINKYYGFDFATESFNKGRDTIYLDIPLRYNYFYHRRTVKSTL